MSDRFPHAQAFDPARPTADGPRARGRSTTSATASRSPIDAYDGTMHFYVTDPNDPIIRAYQGVFPTLFEPLSTHARPTCSAHLRVPEDLFNVQTGMFGRYHVTNTAAVLPERRPVDRPEPDAASRPCRPRPTTSRCACRASEGVEFLLLQPMVPTGRPNMISWVAARMDAPNYGHARSIASRPIRRSSGPPRSRRGSTRTRSSAPRSRSGTSRAATSSAAA